jgi:hypothetical protein
MPETPQPSDRPDRPGRCAVIGAVVGGSLGGLAGLIIGLLVYPPTAVFAMFELGLPGAVVGAIVGLVVGLAARAHRRRPLI